MAQLFVMGDEQLEAIEKLRQFAEANPREKEYYEQRLALGLQPLPEENTLELVPGWRMCFSIDNNPICPMRHLSVSYRDRPPNPVILQELHRLFKFKNEMKDCIGYVEAGFAINVVEPLEGGPFPPEVLAATRGRQLDFSQN